MRNLIQFSLSITRKSSFFSTMNSITFLEIYCRLFELV